MKAPLELPDPLFRKAKATVAERSQLLKDFVANAVREKLNTNRAEMTEPAWMSGFGKLKQLHKTTVCVHLIVDQEFDVIEPEDRR
jgi:hypothetical protein